MFFELGAYQDGGLSHFERCNRFASTAKIKGLAARVCNGSDQFVLYVANILLRGFLGIFNMKKFVEETQLCEIPDSYDMGAIFLASFSSSPRIAA